MVFSGCSSFSNRSRSGQNSTDEKKFYTRSNGDIRRVHLFINRQELAEALKKTQATQNIRLIELFGTSITTPQYRVMDFDRNSVYAILGIRKGDILLAANNFIIPNASIFPEFVKLLPQERNASINLIRGGSEHLFVYEID